MNTGRLFVAAAIAVGACSISCAPQRPVLYPNAHYQSAGAAVAQRDIDECMARAANFAQGGAGTEVARSAGAGAAIGAAAGAAAGAVYGRAGKGAAAGAAGGGAGGAMRGILRSRSPDATTRRFVERCLRDKGYETIGWR